MPTYVPPPDITPPSIGSPGSDESITNSRVIPYDEYGGKYVSIVDTNLFSGSSDSFRTLLGGYFFDSVDENQQLSAPPEFQKLNQTVSINDAIYSVKSFSGLAINKNIQFGETGVPNITEGPVDSDEASPTPGDGYAARQQSTILPYVRFVCQLEGDSRSEHLSDVNTGNVYWNKLFTGGSFNYKTIQPIFNNLIFDQHYTTISLPYEQIYKNSIVRGDTIRKFTEVKYKYNIFDSSYQNTLQNLDSERNAPNWYIINLLSDPEESFKNSDYIDYYGSQEDSTKTLARNVFEPADPFSDTESPSFPALKKLVANTTNSNQQLLQQISNLQKNLLFNANSVDMFLKDNSETVVNADLAPYYINFNLDTERSGKFVDIIKGTKYSTNFLRTLKEVFLEQTNDQLNLDTLQFVLNERSLQLGDSTVEDPIGVTSNNVELKGVDFIQMLLYSHNQIKNENEDFTVVDNTNVLTKAANDKVGAYRAINARNTLKTINRSLEAFTTDINAYSISDIFSLINLRNKSSDDTDTEATPRQPCYNEVLAYRVEKIGGPTSGDLNTQNTIQNFWIFNDSKLNKLNLVDLQAKYGADYTYKVYAYYIVNGTKHKFSNLQLTRIVGNVKDKKPYSSDSDADTGIDPTGVQTDEEITGYCVEYYDPNTNQPVRDLLEGVIGSLDTTVESTTALEDTVRVRKSALSGDTALPPYIANMAVTVQPSLKLVEVPIQTKSITITDYVPNKINVDPSYVLNNSNNLVFNLHYQNFYQKPFPPPIDQTEKLFKNKFLNSQDFTEKTNLVHETVSPARFIDVYRIETKPKSYEDFSDSLYTVLDLRIQDSIFAYKSTIFHDKVKSNKKYYYLFRARNELNVSGQMSQIIEAELINDGGYKYAMFDLINEQDMEVNEFKNISETLKKIIQIIPNSQHLELDDSEVDYSNTAKSQFSKLKIGEAESLIWGKKFKIRLTSKKTGKKIDLNITYNDPNVNLDE